MTVDVTSGKAGTYRNGASNITGSHGLSPTGYTDIEFLAAAIQAVIVTKSATPTTYTVAGETITYRYHVTNTGSVTLLNVNVTDNLPGLSTITCPDTTLAVLASMDCTATYTITQADVDFGSVYNVAIAHGQGSGFPSPTDSPPADFTILDVPVPSIAIVKFAAPPSFTGPGQTLTYNYRVTNNGGVTLDNVGVTDDLPGLSTITCPASTLAPGENMTCSATYVTTVADVSLGFVYNTATAHGTPSGETEPVESPPGDATVPYIQAPALTLEKWATPTTYSDVGQTITYHYRVTNSGGVTMQNVSVIDNLPGLSTITCPQLNLEPGESMECSATYQTTQADLDIGSIYNVATAQGTAIGATEPTDSNPADATVTATANPAITIQKTADVSQFSGSGQTINYTYHVTNTGNVSLDNVGVTDDLPGLSPIICDVTTLLPGQSTDCHATYVTTQADVNSGSVSNTATAQGTPPGGPGPVESPPDSVLIPAVAAPALSLEKFATPTTYSATGQTITYTYRVTNTGNVTLNNVGITDNLPGLSTITCTQTDLNPGESMDCSATYITTQADLDTGSIYNVATAEGTAPGAPGPTVSNPADATVTATANPAITIQKFANVSQFTGPDQPIHYTYYVTNTGNVVLTDVGVTDDLPGLSAIVCNTTTLAPGESTYCNALYYTTVQDWDNLVVSNTATAHGTPPGGTGPVESPPATLDIPAPVAPTLVIEKWADQTSFSSVGQVITYHYRVTNTGNVYITNVHVTDALTDISPVTCDATSLNPGESFYCTAYYTVTQADLDIGSIHNVARAIGYPEGGTEPIISDPAEVIIPATATPAMTLEKTPDPLTYNTVGQTINYTYTVTNTGNVTLTDVGVTDNMPGLSAITCDETTLAPGESTECHATYQITQADLDAGSVRNTARAHGTPPTGVGPPIESPDAEAVITANIITSIEVVKSADTATFTGPGETINYSYLVTNTGDTQLNNISISDDLAGLSAITCDATTLAPGGTTTCHATYVTTQADVDAGSIHNTATASGTGPDGTTVESPPSEVTITGEANPAITLEKSADVSQFTGAGETINYTYHVTNTGNVTLENVGITDDMAGLSTITCDATTLAPGEDTYCHATYVTTQQDADNNEIRNVATAHGTPPGATEPVTSPPDEVAIPGSSNPAITVEKSADRDSFDGANQLITYYYEVTNSGNVTLRDVNVVDDRGISVYCPTDSLEPGQSMTCWAQYYTTQQDVDLGSVSNSATAHGTPPGSTEPIDSPPSDLTIPANAFPAITLEKTADPMTYSAPGQTISYSYLVTNTGNVTLDNIGITDDLVGLNFLGCDASTLEPGQSTYCHATYVTTTEDVALGSIHNTATAHGTPPSSGTPIDSPPSDVTVTAVTNPGITVAKSADPDTYNTVGQTINYTYQVTNTGDTQLDSIGITDNLPGLSAITCDATTLAPGASTTCHATYQVTQADLDNGSINNSATAHGTPPGESPVESPPSDITILAESNPAITVDKSADPTTYSTVGETINYSYHVTNTGNVTLYNIGINDDLNNLSAVTCDASTLAPGESTDCHATYTITQQDVNNGSVHNSATALGTPPGGTGPIESPPSDVTITATANPSLTVDKSADPTTFSGPNQTITYHYLVTNTGNVTLDNVGVTDDQGLLVSCPVTTLEPGQNVDCTATYTTTQADVDFGSIHNSATAHGTPPGQPPVDSPPDDVTVTAEPNPGITVQKTADPVTYSAAGQQIAYTYEVTNTGNVTLDNIGITDDLPGVSAALCDTTTLAPGQSTTCHATYTITQTDVDNGSVHNSATAHGTPPGGTGPIDSPPSDVTITAEPNAGITVAKSADPMTYSTVGETITYTYQVTNTGNESLNNVAITDDLPGLSAITCDTTSLAPGASTTCHATYQITQADLDAGSVHNTATASATEPDGTPVESPPSEVTVISTANPAITVAKSADPTTYSTVGETITYSYHVTNTGDVTLYNVGINDNLPGLSSITCNDSTLAPGQSTDCSATYHITQEDLNNGSVHNSATAFGTPPSATTPIESPPDDVTITANANPGLTVEKSAYPTSFDGAGQTIYYSYRVTNTGNVPLTSVGVTDSVIPYITCASTTLNPGESTTCNGTYTTTQQDVDNGSVHNTATAHGTPPSGGPVESPPDDVTVESTANPAMTVNKSADPMTFSAVGDTINYTYHVTNTGNVTLYSVGITDDLSGLSAITCDTTTLAPGQSTDCHATYQVTQADLNRGYVRNSATAHGTPPGATEPIESPPDEVTVPATSNPGLTVQKSAQPTSFSTVGETIQYTYHVSNTGNVTLDDVGVTDDLPGLSSITCDRTTLHPGESMDCTASYTVTQADLNNGQVRNSATAHGTPPGGEPIDSPPDEVVVPAERNPGMTVRKTADPTSFTAAGETITYRYHVTNTGNVPLTDVGITDSLSGLSDITCDATTLDPGESTDCHATYVTTQADVDNGSVHNSATVHGTPPGGGEPIESPPDEVDVPFKPHERTGLTVRKSADPETFSRAGEEIHYSYRVTNTGTVPLSDIGVTDRLRGLSPITCPRTTLAPGESVTCTATYVTTQEDVSRGTIHNVATAHGRTPDGEVIESPPDDHTEHSTARRGITVRKTVRPKTFSRVGQTLHFSYRVTNTGTVVLHNVRVDDRLPGLSPVRCPSRTLAPRESMTCTATYHVTARDLRNRAVRNRAVAEGTPPGSRIPLVSRPARVTSYGHVPVTG
ncbi:hypothetical protein AB0L06_27410 [Spirillospora sp. NPDC052269]